MQASTYIPNDAHRNAVDLLEHIVLKFDPANLDMVRTDIIRVLGEELGIWPTCCHEAEHIIPTLIAA